MNAALRHYRCGHRKCSQCLLMLFPEETSLAVFLQWAEHYAALTRLAVGQTLMVNQLVDMEWKFGGETQRKADVTSTLSPPPRLTVHIHEHGGLYSDISIACVL